MDMLERSSAECASKSHCGKKEGLPDLRGWVGGKDSATIHARHHHSNASSSTWFQAVTPE